MVVDERHQIAANLSAVQSPLSLRLETVEEGLRAGAPKQDLAQRSVVRILVNAFRESEIEHRVQSEKHRAVAIIDRGVLADVTVVQIVGRRGDLAEQKETALSERVCVFTHV